MRSRFSEWSPEQKIADVFLAILSYFKTYTSFANNFDNAIGTIGVCKQQRTFADFLSDALHNPACRKMWLDDHLIVPIQRKLPWSATRNSDDAYLQQMLPRHFSTTTQANTYARAPVYTRYCPLT